MMSYVSPQRAVLRKRIEELEGALAVAESNNEALEADNVAIRELVEKLEADIDLCQKRIDHEANEHARGLVREDDLKAENRRLQIAYDKEASSDAKVIKKLNDENKRLLEMVNHHFPKRLEQVESLLEVQLESRSHEMKVVYDENKRLLEQVENLQKEIEWKQKQIVSLRQRGGE